MTFEMVNKEVVKFIKALFQTIDKTAAENQTKRKEKRRKERKRKKKKSK